MKNIYILAAGLFFTLSACIKDNSSTGGRVVPEVSVTGLKDTFNVFTFRDFLTVNPVVQNDSRFSYYWTLFSANFTPGQGLVKADTLSRTKDLNYEVKVSPGPYILVFNVQDKETGVTKNINMTVNVSTLNMNGWYMLKDNANKTDFDFVYNGGRIDNWIAYYNGSSLEGNAVAAAFSPGFKSSPSAIDLYNTLVVLSDKDASVYRIDNGKVAMNFNNMFFTLPATRKPQGVYQPIATQNLGFINDGRVYNLTKGGKFSLMPPTPYTDVSPITASAALTIAYDQKLKTIFFIDGGNFVNTAAYMGDTLKAPNGKLEWLTGYTGSRSVALVLFRNAKDTGYLYKLDARYSQLAGYTAGVFLAKDTLTPEHGLMNAGKIAGNYDADYIYYSVGNGIYLTDIATTRELLQFTLPAGEVVTCMQHVKYPQPGSGTNKIDYLAIATYNNGRYKVYLHTISSTGTVQANAADFEGEGRVKNVIYMDQGTGSRIF